MKAKFLHDMAARMAAPVHQMCCSTDTICRDYTQLSHADMAILQADIMRGTEEITELLDQLITEPADA